MNPTMITPEMQVSQDLKALRDQQTTLFDLKDLYALVETSRLAVVHVNASETEAAADVLLMAVNKLADMIEAHQAKAKELEAIAYPEDEQGGANNG